MFESVQQIDFIRDLTIGVSGGYILSWVIFFILLPVFITIFGKVKGTAINYALSWVVWIVSSWYIKQTAAEKL